MPQFCPSTPHSPLGLTNFVYKLLNEAIQSGNFPSSLKWADVTPIFKNGLRCQVDSYRPVSIISFLTWKTFIWTNVFIFWSHNFNVSMRFQKKYQSTTFLITKLKKWRLSKNRGGSFGALLIDLSRAFDCLLHERLIA